MSGFWDLSDGGNAAQSKTTEYEIPGGGNMDPIPDGSSVLAMIDEAKWDRKDEAEYISLRWTVVQPDQFKNRKVFQKLWVTDDDPSAKDADKAAKKRDKARRMLAAIDANAGGKLTSKAGRPNDGDLTMHLTNKPMVIKCMVWEVDDRQTGEKIRGNWIAAVAPKGAELHIAAAAPKKAAKQETFASHAASLDSDSIPF
jgi:hypothetical protein